ncbi:MAG TPA: LD-carboxypeptidase, partial [Asanoa sp.]|nr:LD-carboxypeptidase [Asanoa sp.]
MLVSPSGPTSPERLDRGLELLADWGLRAVPAPHAYDRNGYLAGSDADRAADLNAAFADPEIRGVLCTRGGYGAQRMVDAIDMAAVRRDPKVVAGFSDITAVQFALWRGARLAAVHGPGLAWRDERTPVASAESLRAALMSTDPVTIETIETEDTAGVRVPGIAAGPLLGGNLCLITSSIGTPDMPDLTGAVLLVEEVQEPLYKIDRMFTHLRRAGALDGLAGVALGQFTDCSDDWGTGLTAMLLD